MFHNIQFVCWLVRLIWTQNDFMAFVCSWCNIITTSAIKTFCFTLRRIRGSSFVELLESLFYNLFFSHSWFWLDSPRLFFTHTTIWYFYEQTTWFTVIRCHLILDFWYQVIDSDRSSSLFLLCFNLCFDVFINSFLWSQLLLRGESLVEISWIIMLLWFALSWVLIECELWLIRINLIALFCCNNRASCFCQWSLSR